MGLPEVVSRHEWLVAHSQLPTTRKELIGACDALSAERLVVPVRVFDREYISERLSGRAMQRDLFARRRHPSVEHYVPAWLPHGSRAGSDLWPS